MSVRLEAFERHLAAKCLKCVFMPPLSAAPNRT
jgi:hypothetical protein